MQTFLVTLSLGPVQSLIGAARRTRDLWCGSWLLSEAARAAARCLHRAQPGCLIIPHVANPIQDLEPQSEPGDGANISNVLRAEVSVPDMRAARALCEDAKADAAVRVRDLGRRAREGLQALIRSEVWESQIGDILEAYSAWARVESRDEGYGEASEQLGIALAARKATRNFVQCARLSTGGLPKSSLDGGRETVLRPWSSGDAASRRLALAGGDQVGDQEHLDALGVIKRLAGPSDQFTPVSRIAADPWIERLTSDQRRRLKDSYASAYEALHPLGRGLASRVRGNAGIYADLPFDATLLFPFRMDRTTRVIRETGGLTARTAVKALRECLRQLSVERSASGDAAGSPVPYVAILMADGDRMGKFLSRAASADQSRHASKALHLFASKARGIVQDNRGHCIYAGGDDVLAMLPLTGAQMCARDLAEVFEGELGDVAESLCPPNAERPSLSVGLGIGHLMEPLGKLRARAERAEKLAKGDSAGTSRNAIAFVLGVRSGGEVQWRCRWDDRETLSALERLTDGYRDRRLPARAAYDIRAIDRRLAWLRSDSGHIATGMRLAEVNRMLDRARLEGGQTRLSGEIRELIRALVARQPLRRVADTLIAARWLSARTEADLGERS